MRRRRLWSLMECSRPSSWLNAFVLIFSAPMNPIWPLSKRWRESALDRWLVTKEGSQAVPQPIGWQKPSPEWLASGTKGVESAISIHFRYYLGSGSVKGATEKRGRIRDLRWGRLEIGMKAT